MKNIYSFFILTIFFVTFSIFNFQFSIPVLGQDATDSAISDETVKQSIKERLEKVAKDATPAGSILGSEGLKRAWTGTLEDIANHTLTINTQTGAKQAEVTDKAVILNQNRQATKLENLEIGSFIIAMGYLGNSQVLDTRRVVIANRPEDNLYQSYLVELKNITKTSLSVIDKDNQSLTLATTKSTTITQTVSGESAEIELSDLESGDRLVIIAKPDPKAPTTLDTVAIHLVNSRPISAEPEAATPSAKPE